MSWTSLTERADYILCQIGPGRVEDLCNTLAGMGPTERKEFVKSLVARAPCPTIPPQALNPVEAWWEQKLKSGVLLSARQEEGWVREPSIAELTKDYIAEVKRFDISDKGNATAMGRFLKKVMPKLKIRWRTLPTPAHRIGRSKVKFRYYEMPALPNARKFWGEKYVSRWG